MACGKDSACHFHSQKLGVSGHLCISPCSVLETGTTLGISSRKGFNIRNRVLPKLLEGMEELKSGATTWILASRSPLCCCNERIKIAAVRPLPIHGIKDCTAGMRSPATAHSCLQKVGICLHSAFPNFPVCISLENLNGIQDLSPNRFWEV